MLHKQNLAYRLLKAFLIFKTDIDMLFTKKIHLRGGFFGEFLSI